MGLWRHAIFFVYVIAPFFTVDEVTKIKYGTIFEDINEVYQYYNDEVLKIVNIKQILFYSDVCGVQPDWIGKSTYDDKLVAYYGKERTKECWERWKHYDSEQGSINPTYNKEVICYK